MPEDPHRAAGCHWQCCERNGVPHYRGFDFEGKAEYFVWELKWFELLDWAVYHAPGWESWQEFRKGLVGRPMEQRCAQIRAYWEVVNALHATAPDQFRALADCVRVINLLRSLRGQFSAYPELREFLNEVNPLLDKWWSPRKGKS
jgi:hypothetical protein